MDEYLCIGSVYSLCVCVDLPHGELIYNSGFKALHSVRFYGWMSAYAAAVYEHCIL